MILQQTKGFRCSGSIATTRDNNKGHEAEAIRLRINECAT